MLKIGNTFSICLRKYNVDGEITILVEDNILDSNNTKFILKKSGDLVKCEKTNLPHDIKIDIRELSSLYLGGTSWLNLWKSKLLTNSFRAEVFSEAKKREFPLEINMLENHPFSSQAFIPLQKTAFIAIVAPISEIPDLNSIEAFKIPSEEGINFLPKVWHFPLIATEDSNFLTIDKKDFKNNLEIYNFQNNQERLLNYG
mgnify:CR=1 FL=1